MKITLNNVQDFTNSVFFRLNFEGDWKLLQTPNGETFERIFEFEEAKEFARKVFAGNHIELSGFKQAQIGNGEWDNV
jgi:hypothetical protein